MSLIEQSGASNLLSTRHRTQIHLTPPPSRQDAASHLPEESAASAPNATSPALTPLHTSATKESTAGLFILPNTPQR
jgi:hypothetical protein